MVIVLDGYRATLRFKARATDGYLTITRAEAMRLNAVGIGNHVYLSVRDRVNYELVRYDHVSDWDASDPQTIQLPVTRNAAGLGAKNFAVGACITSEVNSLYIQDLIGDGPGGNICTPSTGGVPSSNSTELPTLIHGSRAALLGRPAGWLRPCPGRVIPYYDEAP